MRRFSWLVLALAMVVSMFRPAMSAPMFPDVPDMWAKDAVAALAAKGILEGYPDGTFKGDRAATRYEVAMIVARLLAKMEQEHATFATKADLDELRRLVNQLKDELDALGVRVQNLEDNVARLDKRVTELERITFYGSLDVRFVSMRMNNNGLSVGVSSGQNGFTGALPAGTAVLVPTGGVYPTNAMTGVPVTTTPSLMGIVMAGAQNLPALRLAVPNGVTGVLTNVFNPVASAASVALPTVGVNSASIALTGVGLPAAFLAGNSFATNIQGRPLYVNEFLPNVNNFNSNVGLGNAGYNLAVGSNRTLGGTGINVASGIAMGGNTFLGTTGMVGQAVSVPLVLPTFEVRTGRPWTQGTGFSGQGILGVRIKLNPDMDAGAEFAAYYSAGDPIVDAFYGVSAVRQANVFASNQALAANTGSNAGLALDAGQGANNSPWNRMVIDNFWFLHKPSNIKVQLGSFGDTHMDSIVYQPEYNPNAFGPRYLDNYGFRVSGRHHLLAPFEWEVFGSQVADGNRLVTNFPVAVGLGATPYKPYMWGVDGKWTFGQEGNQGRIKFNLLRIWDDNAAGQATTVGSIVGVNGVWTDWANPNGYYAAQQSTPYFSNATGLTLNPNAGRVAGIGSTSDQRPIIPNIAGNGGAINPTTNLNSAPVYGIDTTGSGLFGTLQTPLVLALNNATGALAATGTSLAAQYSLPTSSFGPQSMFTWGVSGGWDYTWNDNVKMRFLGEYGNSSYKPSANSPYKAPQGDAYRFGLGFTLFSDFDIDGEYLSVNPYYNPYIMQYPNVNGVTQAYWRIPTLSWFPELYPVNDKDVYPNNREGFRVNFKWNPVDPKDGKHKTVFYGEYGNMGQQTSSLQSVRYSPGSIFTGNLLASGVPDPNSMIPNGFVLGQNPGYIDTIFTGFHPTSYAGYTGSFAPSAVNQFATPLENPRGRVTNWGVGLNYRFDTLGGLGIHAGYKDWQFRRASSLTPQFGGSENNININNSGGLVALNFPVNERFSVKGGYAWTSVKGHYDPTGIYRNFALDSGNIGFQTFNQDQTSPFVGFDYDIAKNVNWNLTAKWLDSHDNLGTFSSQTFFMSRNPFSWSGFQLTSQVKVSF